MAPRFEAVIFDFDYTLADSTRGAIACIGYALAQMGLSPASDADASRTIGLSLPETFRVLTGDADPERGAAFEALFIAHAAEAMTPRTVLLSPTRGAVTRLHSAGYRLGIVSTKYRRRIREVLARDGLLDVFDVIVGGEDVSRLKPNPEGLRAALGRLRSEHVLYVGDSVTDARAAKAASLPFVAVLTGTTPRDAFLPYSPHAVLRDVGELPELLNGHTSERSDT